LKINIEIITFGEHILHLPAEKYFLLLIIRSNHKSDVEQEITKSQQKQVIQCVQNLAEFYFMADFRQTKFGGKFFSTDFRRIHIRRIYGGLTGG